MTFEKWLDTFIEEKGLDLEHTFEIEGPLGLNMIPLGNVVQAMKITHPDEQKAIKAMVVKIDFANGDVLDYFKHLARAIAL